MNFNYAMNSRLKIKKNYDGNSEIYLKNSKYYKTLYLCLYKVKQFLMKKAIKISNYSCKKT
jgi:hypothetical protein